MLEQHNPRMPTIRQLAVNSMDAHRTFMFVQILSVLNDVDGTGARSTRCCVFTVRPASDHV